MNAFHPIDTGICRMAKKVHFANHSWIASLWSEWIHSRRFLSHTLQ